jgi:hypothetical protein
MFVNAARSSHLYNVGETPRPFFIEQCTLGYSKTKLKAAVTTAASISVTEKNIEPSYTLLSVSD